MERSRRRGREIIKGRRRAGGEDRSGMRGRKKEEEEDLGIGEGEEREVG